MTSHISRRSRMCAAYAVAWRDNHMGCKATIGKRRSVCFW